MPFKGHVFLCLYIFVSLQYPVSKPAEPGTQRHFLTFGSQQLMLTKKRTEQETSLYAWQSHFAPGAQIQQMLKVYQKLRKENVFMVGYHAAYQIMGDKIFWVSKIEILLISSFKLLNLLARF